MRLRKPKKLTIDRSKWVQGGREFRSILGAPKLLNSHGNMCCLGFYSKACGVPDEELENQSLPAQLDVRVPYLTAYKGGQIYDSDLAQKLAGINDHDSDEGWADLTLKKKEKLIRENFKKIDVKVRFTGTYPEGVEDAFA